MTPHLSSCAGACHHVVLRVRAPAAAFRRAGLRGESEDRAGGPERPARYFISVLHRWGGLCSVCMIGILLNLQYTVGSMALALPPTIGVKKQEEETESY